MKFSLKTSHLCSCGRLVCNDYGEEVTLARGPVIRGHVRQIAVGNIR